MNMTQYKLVLSQPGLRALMLIGLVARIPATAVGMLITLHVVTSLNLGYAEAGIAGALGMAGAGVGAPLAGRLVDRFGTRPVMTVTTAAQGIFWAIAPSLDYGALVAGGFVAGMLSIPIFSVMRQFLAALVPLEQRRTAFALDSMAVELSYMVGPALAVAGVTSIGSHNTMYVTGAGLVVAGLTLIGLNPPIMSAEEAAQIVERIPRRQWLTRSMVLLFALSATITFVLSATELSVVAALRDDGATAWTGLVIGIWCAYSLIGGFIYGALHRGVSTLLLVGGLAAFTIPVGLVGGGWWWLLLALLPSGLLTAPSIAATVDTVSSWVPAGARGEAMGLHGTALTVGVAVGAPIAGAVIDAFGASWGFAMAGAVGVVLTLAMIPAWPHQPQPAAQQARLAPVPAEAVTAEAAGAVSVASQG